MRRGEGMGFGYDEGDTPISIFPRQGGRGEGRLFEKFRRMI